MLPLSVITTCFEVNRNNPYVSIFLLVKMPGIKFEILLSHSQSLELNCECKSMTFKRGATITPDVDMRNYEEAFDSNKWHQSDVCRFKFAR